ncbi:DUF4214 domain-containing protein [Sphingomonas yantingensis]|uniref:DUF4214 domain-containing protein n=1 Tax=Sphingomonas yantingensis TaxID=1241761 RepID=UPI0031B5EDF6
MARIEGTAGNDVLTGTDGEDVIYGFAGDDTIDGVLGADQLYGGAGNDLFRFSAVQFSSPAPTAVGLIDGGDDFDTIDLRSVSPVVLGTIQNGPGRYVAGIYVGSQKYEIANVERVLLGSGNDWVSLPSSIVGLEVRTGGGNDDVFVSVGIDLFLDDGDDTAFLSGFTNGSYTSGSIDGGTGTDLLKTNIGFVVEMGKGFATSFGARFTISGFENLEMNTYSIRAEGHGDDRANVMTAAASTRNDDVGVLFDGAGGDDTITGSRFADELYGGSGDDRIDGGDGDDRLFGGAGNDVLQGGAGNDAIDGGAGFDRAAYTGLYRTYAPSVANGTLTVRGGGSEGTDTLTGVESVTFRDGVFQIDPDAAFAQVLRVYDTVLGRAPDPVGLDYYVDRMEDAKVLLAAVANEIAGSKEFQEATGGLSNAAFVDYVYEHALRRAPDAGGKAYYTEALNNGMTRGAFVVDLSESAEHRGLTASLVAKGFFNTDDTFQSVALLYDGFTNRLPDAGGLTYYAERVKAGVMTLAQVTAEFAGSSEFAAAIAGKNNGQIVDYIYQNSLDRAPDAGGRAFYTDQLDKGASAAAVLQDVALSVEHYNLFSAHILQGIDVIV